MADVLSATLGSFLIAVVMTGLMRRYATAKQLLDIPGARSSHTISTPRGGGVAIVVGFFIIVILAALFGAIQQRYLVAMLPALTAVAVVGFWDDHRHVLARFRIVVHFVSVVWAAYWLGGELTIDLPYGVAISGWPVTALVIVAIIWFLNLFNFMDGIDGIAASEAVFIAFIGAVMTGIAGMEGLSLAFLALGAAAFGFLLWNWYPAKIFMGDVGSGFLGAALAFLGYAAAVDGVVTIWSWVILAAVFVTDATMTLGRRFLQGDRWYMPHRSHAYQWASRRWGHKAVTVTVVIIDIGWLLPLAYFAFMQPRKGIVITLVAYIPLIVLALVLGAGKKEDAVKS